MPEPIDLPPEDCKRISRRALDIARSTAPRARFDSKGGARALRAWSQTGQVGINVPEQAKHLLHQERGIRSFVQTKLKGKVVPIRDKDSGEIVFRYVNPQKTGKFKTGPRKTVHLRNASGQLISTPLTRRHWTHPGLAPKNFLRKAIDQAIKEYMDELPSRRVWEILEANGVHPELSNFSAQIKER